MGRPKRIVQHLFPYSVTTRCNNRNFYMKRKKAHRIFEKIFRKLKNTPLSEKNPLPKYQFEIHHLTVMSNHYHLVISVSNQTPIHKIMQLINSLVAKEFNKLLHRRGHFWEDRFKSKVLDSLDYLKKTIAYLYHNPLKANLSHHILAYTKSTFPYYWKQKLPSWLTPDPLLQSIPKIAWQGALQELVLHSYQPLQY